jgi:hypothetical protein
VAQSGPRSSTRKLSTSESRGPRPLPIADEHLASSPSRTNTLARDRHHDHVRSALMVTDDSIVWVGRTAAALTRWDMTRTPTIDVAVNAINKPLDRIPKLNNEHPVRLCTDGGREQEPSLINKSLEMRSWPMFLTNRRCRGEE